MRTDFRHFSFKLLYFCNEQKRNGMEKKLFLIVVLLVAIIGMASTDVEADEKRILAGKPHPSVDSTVTVSYNNGIVNIQSKSQQVSYDVNVSIRNAEGNVIYTREVPLIDDQTTSICLPEDVDEEKCALEIEYGEEKRLKVYF